MKITEKFHKKPKVAAASAAVEGEDKDEQEAGSSGVPGSDKEQGNTAEALSKELQDIQNQRIRLRDQFLVKANEELGKLHEDIKIVDSRQSALYKRREEIEGQLKEFGSDILEVHGIKLSQDQVTNFESSYREASTELKHLKKEKVKYEQQIEETKKVMEDWEKIFFPKIGSRFKSFIAGQSKSLHYELVEFANELAFDHDDQSSNKASKKYNTRFNRALLILRQPYGTTFQPQTEEDLDDYGYKVRRRMTHGMFVCIGWINDELPMLYCLASVIDAVSVMNFALDAQAINEIRIEVLKRMVWYYRFQVEHVDNIVRKYKEFSNISQKEYDALLQEIEDMAGDFLEKPDELKAIQEQKKQLATKKKSNIVTGVSIVIAIILVVFFLSLIFGQLGNTVSPALTLGKATRGLFI